MVKRADNITIEQKGDSSPQSTAGAEIYTESAPEAKVKVAQNIRINTIEVNHSACPKNQFRIKKSEADSESPANILEYNEFHK